MKKKKIPKIYKETPEERKERVQNEGRAFAPRVEQPKNIYDRKREKKPTVVFFQNKKIRRVFNFRFELEILNQKPFCSGEIR